MLCHVSAFGKIPDFRITNSHEISAIGYSKFALHEILLIFQVSS